MGKRIISQRRGRGTPTYKASPSGKKYKPVYVDEKGKITDILHDAGRDAPIIEITYNGGKTYMVAPKNVKVGDTADSIGVPLKDIPESVPIFGIETYPNSGPKLCMAPGTASLITSKTESECTIQLPSKAKKVLNPNCRATIGIPAGEGRSEKPWIKAGNKWIAMHRRGKLYPRTSGKAMNAVDHPFGSGYGGGVGRPKTISRHAPPGRKVGSIAARRTGRRKK